MSHGFGLRLVLVSGAARSGTSLVTGILARMGAFSGSTIGPHPENPRGFFEHAYIRDRIVKPAIAAAGADPCCQASMPPRDLTVPRLRARVLAAFGADGWDGQQPLVLKTIKGLLFWPAWVEAFPEAEWVVTRRGLDAVAASCLRTSFMTAHDTAADWRAWAEQFEQRAAELSAAAPVLRVDADALVRGEWQLLPALCARHGLRWQDAVARNHILPEAWHADPIHA